jgi:hypothetical protein
MTLVSRTTSFSPTPKKQFGAPTHPSTLVKHISNGWTIFPSRLHHQHAYCRIRHPVVPMITLMIIPALFQFGPCTDVCQGSHSCYGRFFRYQVMD